MNIDDVKQEELKLPSRNRILFIIKRQQELMDKYQHIEAKKGVPIPERPYHIDNHTTQMAIKDHFWRATEEISEALEFRIDFNSWRDRWSQDAGVRHFFEELADALHFLAEASIYAGQIGRLNINEDDIWEAAGRLIPPLPDGVPVDLRHVMFMCSEFIFFMGLTANCLKNKPWKQSQMPTDTAKFNAYMVTLWSKYFAIWRTLGCEWGDILVLYLKKHAVNQFRQRSKY